jgi:hypothetical protein
MEAFGLLLAVGAVLVFGYAVHQSRVSDKPVTKRDLQPLSERLQSHYREFGDAGSAIKELRRSITAIHDRLDAIEYREMAAVRARLNAIEYRISDTE